MFPTSRRVFALCRRNFPSRVLLGRHASHTSAFDGRGRLRHAARLRGRLPLRPRRGVMASGGQRVKLSRPLDFLVITDHSDGMGFFPRLLSGDPTCSRPEGRRWYDMVKAGGAQAALEIIASFGGAVAEGLPDLPGTHGYRKLARDHRGGGEIQRAGPLHRLHRLRVDLARRRQQPAPQRHLSRRRRQGPRSSRSPPPTARQHEPGRPLGVDGDDRGQDRRPGARDPAQRQSLQRPDVPDHEPFTGSARPRLCRDPRALGAALRGDADQGRRRDTPVLSPTTSSPTSRSGTRAT